MSPQECEAFLAEQKICRVGSFAEGRAYVVPVIYAWHEGAAYVYTTEGQKTRMMRENPVVSLEIDEYLEGGSWKSVIVEGVYEELDDDGARTTLSLLSAKMPPNPTRERQRAERPSGRAPVAFRVRAEAITGRRIDRS